MRLLRRLPIVTLPEALPEVSLPEALPEALPEEVSPEVSPEEMTPEIVMSKLMQRFADECLIYMPLSIVIMRDVRIAFSNWLINQPEFNFDFPMSFRHKQFCQMVPKFRCSHVSVCKSCRQRIRVDCCDKHDRKHNATTLLHLVNAKLKCR